MIKIRPRGYQKNILNKAFDYCNNDKINRLLIHLPTGGGKSVIIKFLAEGLTGRTLILTNRQEILNQNFKIINNCKFLVSDYENCNKKSKIVIAMVETLHSRIKNYGKNYIGDFDNIIVDEAHILVFKKVYDNYNFKNLIGLTATPVLNKLKVNYINDIRYVRKYAMSDFYDALISDVDTIDMIGLGYLAKDKNYMLVPNNFKQLKINSEGEYSKDSLDNVYASSASLKILKNAYDKYCLNKKTIIFNSSTKVNKKVYEHFKKYNYNVKLFDSKSNANRNDIIDWFKNNKNAILINTGVFTTGFDEPSIECVIVNRATKSLGLWLQMVGRGARIKDNKKSFTVIDLGNNIIEHKEWSARRDWQKLFLAEDFKATKKTDLLSTWDCILCGNINIITEIKCSNEKCNNTYENNKLLIKAAKTSEAIKTRSGKIIEVVRPDIPNAKNIIDYTVKLGGGATEAFKLAERKIIDMFILYDVSKEFYKNNRERFIKRIRYIYIPIYFAIIKNKKLYGKNRKLNTQLNLIYKKIDKLYDYECKNNQKN